MKDYLKSQTLILSLALSISGILGFWALQKNSCLEVSLTKEIKIKVGICNITNSESPFSRLSKKGLRRQLVKKLKKTV